MSLNVLSVDENVWEKVAKTYNRNKKSLDEDVQVLQIWLKTQLHLPNILDANSLRNFLIINKCSIEVTKQKIENYYTVRSKIKELSSNINPKLPYLQELNDLIYIVVLPELTDEMYRVGLMKVKNDKLIHKFNDHSSTFKKLYNLQEMKLRDDILYGEVVIMDCSGMSSSWFLKFTPTLLYNSLLVYERVFTLHCKAIYIINMPSLGVKILNQLKNMLKPKIFQRIHLFSDAESLKNVIPLRILPKDYGGEGHSLDVLQEALNEKFREHQSLFDNLDEMKVDENLRIEKPKNDEWGVYGNFKNLDID